MACAVPAPFLGPLRGPFATQGTPGTVGATVLIRLPAVAKGIVRSIASSWPLQRLGDSGAAARPFRGLRPAPTIASLHGAKRPGADAAPAEGPAPLMPPCRRSRAPCGSRPCVAKRGRSPRRGAGLSGCAKVAVNTECIQLALAAPGRSWGRCAPLSRPAACSYNRPRCTGRKDLAQMPRRPKARHHSCPRAGAAGHLVGAGLVSRNEGKALAGAQDHQIVQSWEGLRRSITWQAGLQSTQPSRRRSGGIGRSSFSGSGGLPLPARYWRIWNT